MRIGYPTGLAKQFYQANALARGQSSSLTGLAPHAETIRNTYTVPAGKRAVITSCQVGIQRVTAAAPIGRYKSEIYAVVNANTPSILRIMTLDNTVNFMQFQSIGSQIWLAAGDSINFSTEDLSTGGTVSYWGSFSYTEFDA